jgi:polar amino acid transport system substrate-binding protein
MRGHASTEQIVPNHGTQKREKTMSGLSQTPRRVAAAVVACAFMLTAAACGGQSLGDNNGDSGKKEASEVVTAPAEDLAADVINAIEASPALSSKVPAEVAARGLKVTTSVGYPPMEMFAEDGQTIIGVDAALGRAIARKLGVGVSIADEDFNSQIPGVTTARYDMILSSMTDNAERREVVTFVDYVSAGNGFLVKRGNPSGIEVPMDLCGKTTSVVDSGSALVVAQAFDADCKAAGKPGIKILRFPGDSEAILQVQNGRSDATITDYPVAAYRAAAADSAVDAIAIAGDESLWGIAMAPEASDLIDAVQGALQELIDSGEYEQILAAYKVEQMAVDSAEVNGGE